MAKQILTAERLKEMFHYDPLTGVFNRRISSGRSRAGSFVGWVEHDGYLRVCIDKKKYSLHRLAWLYVFGHDPKGEIDHIDGCKTDNRICNLRDVPRQTNAENARLAHRHNKSGLLGAHGKKTGKFESWIQASGTRHYLGLFDRAEDAHDAYINAKRELHAGCTI